VGLANRPIKPLWYLSSNISNTLAQFSSCLGALLVHCSSEGLVVGTCGGSNYCKINPSYAWILLWRSGKPRLFLTNSNHASAGTG
jgi:hypothetical protein